VTFSCSAFQHTCRLEGREEKCRIGTGEQTHKQPNEYHACKQRGKSQGSEIQGFISQAVKTGNEKLHENHRKYQGQENNEKGFHDELTSKETFICSRNLPDTHFGCPSCSTGCGQVHEIYGCDNNQEYGYHGKNQHRSPTAPRRDLKLKIRVQVDVLKRLQEIAVFVPGFEKFIDGQSKYTFKLRSQIPGNEIW